MDVFKVLGENGKVNSDDEQYINDKHIKYIMMMGGLIHKIHWVMSVRLRERTNKRFAAGRRARLGGVVSLSFPTTVGVRMCTAISDYLTTAPLLGCTSGRRII